MEIQVNKHCEVMNKSLGGILKLNRIQKKYPIKLLSHESGLSVQCISKVERNKESIKSENIIKLFQIIGIDVYDGDIDEQFEEDFIRFYEDLYYEDDFKKSYQVILSYKNIIQGTCSYVKYLLAEMIFQIMICQEKPFRDYKYLENYFCYLEEYQKQLYYDYMGLLLRDLSKENDSVTFYNIALQYKGNDYSKAMVNYHFSTGLCHIGKYQEALESAYVARDIFAKTMNIKRLSSVSFQIATIYSRNKQYEEAEKLFQKSLKAFYLLKMENDLRTTFNNLIWHYIRAQEYEKIILLEKDVLSVIGEDHRIYFYLSYAYYKLGNHSNAVKYIKMAKHSMGNPTVYMKSMIHAFSVYLSNASIARKEKQLLDVQKKANLTEDIDLIIFAEGLLREFYKETNQTDKYVQSVEQLLKCYENK